MAALTKEPRLRRNDTSKGFPHSCKPELRHKAAIMGSGPGKSGRDRRNPATPSRGYTRDAAIRPKNTDRPVFLMGDMLILARRFQVCNSWIVSILASCGRPQQNALVCLRRI